MPSDLERITVCLSVVDGLVLVHYIVYGLVNVLRDLSDEPCVSGAERTKLTKYRNFPAANQVTV